MKIELNLTDGTMLTGVYLRGDGWGAIVRCTPGFWPSKYRQTFADLRPPEPKYHECSGAAAGCNTAQAAIDLAYEKMVLTMKFLDGIIRTDRPTKAEPKLDTAVIAGLDLGGLDL
jgi:hypothetical protein